MTSEQFWKLVNNDGIGKDGKHYYYFSSNINNVLKVFLI